MVDVINRGVGIDQLNQVFDDFNDVHEGDTVEVYKMVEKPRD